MSSKFKSMSSFQFDSLKAEKADAIRRFNRKKNFTSFIQLVGAFSLLFYSFIIIIKSLSPITLTITSQQFYPFVLVNTIMFLIYQSSTTKTPENNQNDAAAAAASQPDLFDEYVSFSFSYRPETTTTTCDGDGLQLADLSPVGPEEKIPTSSSSSDQQENDTCKDLIVSDNVVDFSENHCANSVRDVVVVDNYDDAVKSDGRRLRRSWSEKGCGGRGGGVKVLRRSETGNGREVVAGLAVNGRRKSVQEMDNEEFRMAIERFIASKKKILRDENTGLLIAVEEKDHY